MKATLFTILAVGLLAGLSSPSNAQVTVTNAKTPPTKCSLHHVALKPDMVRISYGLPFMSKELMKARTTLFPYSRLEALGGCVVSANSPKFMKVNYCEKCRAAELKWNKTHKNR